MSDEDITFEQQQEQRASLRDRGIAKTHLDGAAAAGSVEVDRCWRRLSSSPLAVGCLVVVVLVAVANLSSTLLATALFSGGATRESNAGAAPAGPIVAAVPTATTKHGAGRAGQASAWPRPLPASVVDAAVFIVIGDLAAGPAAAVAVEALRRRGQWHGPVVMLTDRPGCLEHLNGFDRGGAAASSSSSSSPSFSAAGGGWGVTIVPVTGLPLRENHAKEWLLAVKALKTRLFSLVVPSVPAARHWEFMLYLDVDVWAAQPLQGDQQGDQQGDHGRRSRHGRAGGGDAFLDHIAPLVRSTQVPPPEQEQQQPLSKKQAAAVPWIVLFADCAAHAVGWCAGCETWNTGVMVVPNHLNALPPPPPAAMEDEGRRGKGGMALVASGAEGRKEGGPESGLGSESPLYHDVTAQCLARWRGVMESGRFGTDQEALEAAVREAPRIHQRISDNAAGGASSLSSSALWPPTFRRRRGRRRLGGGGDNAGVGAAAGGDDPSLPGLCDGVVTVPDPSMRHLLFMKDYLALPGIALGITGGGGGGGGSGGRKGASGWPTFCHVTAANRIETQDWLYVRLARWLHASLGLHSPFESGLERKAASCS